MGRVGRKVSNTRKGTPSCRACSGGWGWAGRGWGPEAIQHAQNEDALDGYMLLPMLLLLMMMVVIA